MGDGRSSEKPILLDEEENKENSPPTTPVSDRSTETPRLLRSRPFENGLKMCRKMIKAICLNNCIECVCVILLTIN